jgi:hypothetical protein
MDTNTTIAKPVEIFRPGTFVASNGQKYTFTPEHVREIAETYNPDFADAPYVVGHPKLTSPRFGRAARLFINDKGVLCSDSADVVPEFAQAVNSKLYPKISASIYLPDAPGNPVPGKYYLRHVGFLGGAAPAVKGLKSVEFSADTEGVVDFGYEDRLVATLFRRLREWIVAKDGSDEADKVIQGWEVDTLAEAAVREEVKHEMQGQDCNPTPVPGFSTPPTNQEDELNLAEQQQALADREAALNARAAELAKKEAEVKKTGFADFAEQLVKEGKLLPVQKESVVEIMAQLDSANKIADFAEGHENHGKTGADLFKEFLAAQPKQVEFNRVSQPAAAVAGAADFAAPNGEQVDQEGLVTLAKAQAYMKEHKVDLITAVQAVQAG